MAVLGGPLIDMNDKNKNILQEADELVSGPRNGRYGHPRDSFAQIGRVWAEILGVPVTPEQVGLCMIAMKVCRFVHRPDKLDSLVDICGYARTIEMIREPSE